MSKLARIVRTHGYKKNNQLKKYRYQKHRNDMQSVVPEDVGRCAQTLFVVENLRHQSPVTPLEFCLRRGVPPRPLSHGESAVH